MGSASNKKAWRATGPQFAATSAAPADAPQMIEHIESLRRQRMPGKEIAATVGVSAAVSAAPSSSGRLDRAL
jgi:hypothetical protein